MEAIDQCREDSGEDNQQARCPWDKGVLIGFQVEDFVLGTWTIVSVIVSVLERLVCKAQKPLEDAHRAVHSGASLIWTISWDTFASANLFFEDYLGAVSSYALKIVGKRKKWED